MSEGQSLCRMPWKEGPSGPFLKEKDITESLLYAVSPLILLSLTFPNCLEANAAVLHCGCEHRLVISRTDIDGDE